MPLPAATRERHSAVYDTVGMRMLVYGGFGDLSNTNSVFWPGSGAPGGRTYDPAQNTWDILSPQSGEPTARADHSAVWDGTRLLVFGGTPNNSTAFSDGYKFEGGWSAFNGTPPAGRFKHTAVWLDTPKRMIVWGGTTNGSLSTVLDSGGVYDPAANTWETAPPTAVSGRMAHTAVSTGGSMIVWGGLGTSGTLNTGGVYTP